MKNSTSEQKEGTTRATLHNEVSNYLHFLKNAGVTYLPAQKEVAGDPLVSTPAEQTSVPTSKPEETHSNKLDVLNSELSNCQRCRLHENRKTLVFGVGNPDADLLFIGEAPGFEEDRTGEPFVGKAGQLLTKIIEAMGLKREEVYICNVIKCRPPENRNPLPDEIETCEPFLSKQIEAISPKVVCALGKFAAQTLLKKEAPISTLRGQFHDFKGTPLMPTYHPAFLLRNPSAKRQVWDDIKEIKRLLDT